MQSLISNNYVIMNIYVIMSLITIRIVLIDAWFSISNTILPFLQNLRFLFVFMPLSYLFLVKQQDIFMQKGDEITNGK